MYFVIKLIFKKLNNTLTKEEEIIFNEWLAESEDHQAYFDQIKSNKETIEMIKYEYFKF